MPGDSIVDDLGAFLKNQRHTAQMSLRDLATAAGVSNPYLSQIERGLRRPSADVLQQIAHGLQISAAALYARAGLLDDPSGDTSTTDPTGTTSTSGPTSTSSTADPTGTAAAEPAGSTSGASGAATPAAATYETAAPAAASRTPGVVSAIQNDLHLDPAQRRALIDVYNAFVSDGRTNRE